MYNVHIDKMCSDKILPVLNPTWKLTWFIFILVTGAGNFCVLFTSFRIDKECEYAQRHIQNPFKHLRWSVLRK